MAFFLQHITKETSLTKLLKINNVYDMLEIKELTMKRFHEYIMRVRERDRSRVREKEREGERENENENE